jgi:hypothetical protein
MTCLRSGGLGAIALIAAFVLVRYWLRNRFDRGAIIAGITGSTVLIVGWLFSTGILGPLAKSWCDSGALNRISLWALGLSLLTLVPAALIHWGIPIPPYNKKTK